LIVAAFNPSRRAVLAALAASVAAPKLGWAAAGNPAFLGCAKETDGSFALHGFTQTSDSVFRIPLPARGHAGARHPARAEAVVFARRPGTYALVIDVLNGKVAKTLQPPAGLHLNGHGAYLQNGALLVTAEQMSETSEGRLGLWAANENYRRIGDLPSGGIGPHEVLALPDGTLAIANGGIKTLAGTRDEIGTEEMRPSLAFADAEARLTDILKSAEEFHFASIRHLAALPNGHVAAACQWHGHKLGFPQSVPLLAMAKAGGQLKWSNASQDLWDIAKGYAGSIAATEDGLIAITAPRGNRLYIFDQTGALVAAHTNPDVCGVAASGNGFIASNGEGALLRVDLSEIAALGAAKVSWDNHIVAVA
jgi:uncharacterized protein